MERLGAMSGSAFDTAYMQHMVQDLAEFGKQAQSGSDPALKSFAQKYLPIIQRTLRWRSEMPPRAELGFR